MASSGLGLSSISVESRVRGELVGQNIASGALVGPKAVSDVYYFFLLARILDNLHH